MAECRSKLSQYYQSERARSKALIANPPIHDWGATNSRLFSGAADADMDNSFQFDFGRVLPEGAANLKEYIESLFKHKKGKVRGLELGGIGSHVFSAFSKNFFRKTAGVTILDDRHSSLKTKDFFNNHKVILGDFFEDKTKKEVKDTIGNVDVIFMRLLGGQECMPRDPFFMSGEAAYWYQQLNVGGVMFVEIPAAFRSPTDFRDLMTPWIKSIQENYQGRIEVKASEGALRLVKLPGAPEELPLLRMKDVFGSEKISLERRLVSTTQS